jgi:hypothetical protein
MACRAVVAPRLYDGPRPSTRARGAAFGLLLRLGGSVTRRKTALINGMRTVILTAVPAEDGNGWQVELKWDDGQCQRVLHFPSKKDAEFWIGDPHL